MKIVMLAAILITAATTVGGTIGRENLSAVDSLKLMATVRTETPPASIAAPYHAVSVEPYVDFLKAKGQDAVEYMVNLFDKHDIVIFCERMHPEFTQYEFLSKVVSHPKFAELVGGIFTEVGSASQQERMDEFLQSDRLDDKLLIKICQEFTFFAYGWPNDNINYFWKNVWQVNSRLGKNEKIWLYPSDMPWAWQDIKTKEDYRKMANRPRDSIMADGIISRIEKLSLSGGKKQKFLVIMNTRHAMGTGAQYAGDGVSDGNVGAKLKLKYPDKTFIILQNQPRAWTGGEGDFLIGDGVWDAAFLLNGNKSMGFTLENSPFGLDPFDFLSTYKAANYQSVFDGFVFTAPLKKLGRRTEIYPGFYDNEFIEETKRRCSLIEDCTPIDDGVLQSMNNGTGPSLFYADNEQIESQIRKWLPDAAVK